MTVLAGCGGGGNVATSNHAPTSEAQRFLAAQTMSADELRAAKRSALPPGTRIYPIEMDVFSVPGGLQVVDPSAVVSFSGSTLVLRLADGSKKTIEGAQFVKQDRYGETHVLPGKPVPAHLQGQTPSEIVQ